MSKTKSTLKDIERSKVSLRFQILFITISMSIFLFLLSWRVSFFIPEKTLPTLKPMTPKVFKQFGGFANTVETGLFINQFINFNMVDNEFTFDGTVWFAFDPGAISMDILDKFSFLKGDILSKSPPDIKLIDEKLNVKYTVRVKFRSTLNYRNFPLDDHQIYIVIINQTLTPSEVVFESSRRKLVVEANVSAAGWDLVDHSVQVGYFESQLDPDNPKQSVVYPAVMFILDYSRNSIRYALSIVLPLIMIFYLILFSVSLQLRSAISMTAGGITAILAYRFVIENLSPKTGVFMISDYLFFLFLAVTIAVFVINVAEAGFKVPSWVKKITILCLHITVIAIVLYLFLG